MNKVIDALAYLPKSLGLMKSLEEEDIISFAFKYNIIDELDTLDILLLNGKGFWFSYVVEWATWSQFSHIGIVLKSPTWLHPSLTDDYLLESGTEPTPDAIDHKLKFGVQITPLKTLLENYNGKIYYRKLDSLPFRENPGYYQSKLSQIFEMIKDKPYDDNSVDLIKVELGLKLGDCQRTNSFFCSALTSFIYTQLGFLPADTQWDLIEPKDFDIGYKIEQNMQKQNIGYLGPLIQIK